MMPTHLPTCDRTHCMTIFGAKRALFKLLMYLCKGWFDGLTFSDKKLLKDVRVSVCHSPKCDREYPNPGPDKSKSAAPNKGRCLFSVLLLFMSCFYVCDCVSLYFCFLFFFFFFGVEFPHFSTATFLTCLLLQICVAWLQFCVQNMAL